MSGFFRNPPLQGEVAGRRPDGGVSPLGAPASVPGLDTPPPPCGRTPSPSGGGS